MENGEPSPTAATNSSMNPSNHQGCPAWRPTAAPKQAVARNVSSESANDDDKSPGMRHPPQHPYQPAQANEQEAISPRGETSAVKSRSAASPSNVVSCSV